MNNDIREICVDCGEEFIITAGEVDYMESQGFSIPKRCKPCRQDNKENSRTEICKDCGEEFVISANEIKSYANKGLNIPKRCKPCRRKRRNDQK